MIVGGVGNVAGVTMAEKKTYLQQRHDDLRTMLMLEPRGHRDMFGVLLTPPCRPEADMGLIFMDSGGYIDMCGHGTIGAVTVMLETGMLPAPEPVTRLLLDTPAGLVKASACIEGGRVKSVTVENVAAFVYARDLAVTVPSLGTITLDIAYGGNFFALVRAESLGLSLDDASTFIAPGLQIRDTVNRTLDIRHPLEPCVRGVQLVEFYGPPRTALGHGRNVVIFGNGQYDRSPCGTGSCAKLALLHQRGELALGEEYVHESIIGTTFRVRAVEQTQVGCFAAIVPEITGRAFITGIQQFVADPEDPMACGRID